MSPRTGLSKTVTQFPIVIILKRGIFLCCCMAGFIGVLTCGTGRNNPLDSFLDPFGKPVIEIVNPHDGDTIMDTLRMLIKVKGWDTAKELRVKFIDPADTSTSSMYYLESGSTKPVAVVADTAFFELKRDIMYDRAQRRLVAKVLQQQSYQNTGVPEPEPLAAESLTVTVCPLVLSVDNWTHGEVYKIVEDSSGVVWLLTEKGLYYYNGLRFGYVTELIPGMAGIRSRKIAVDPEGNLWVDSIGDWTSNGCPAKLIVWKGAQRIATYPFPLIYDCIGDMGFDRNGSFLAISPDGYSGFVTFKDDSLVRIEIERCNGANHVYGVSRRRMLFDNQNRLWITTNSGVALMSGEGCDHFDTSNNDWPVGGGHCIALSPDGRVYVQFDEHIASYNAAWHTEITKQSGEYEGMDVDADGNLWVLQYFTGPIVVKISDGKVVRGFGRHDTYSGDVHVCKDGTVVAGGANAILFIREKGFSPDAHL
ncbi:MAG: hypothetical protein JW863_01280 [Chitinispirillaceae bacterium]|nr:hypothetical protein [Chitinispirillaceae bacterium]